MAEKGFPLPWRRRRDVTTVSTEASDAFSPSGKLWTRSFALVCLAACFAYSSTSILGPIIPLRVVDLGGSSATAGIVIAIFGAIGFILRPLAGRLIDAWKATGVFAYGSVLVGLGSLSWLVPSGVTPYFAQIATGVGWSGVGPGGQSMVGILTPATRRGEAAGYYQVALTAGPAALPALGLWLLDANGFAIVFLLAGLLGFFGAFAVVGIESQPRPVRPAQRSQSFLSALFEKEALLPSSFVLLSISTGPATTSFLPLLARDRGIDNVAAIFLIGGVVAVVAQLTLGRASDRIGRDASLFVGFVISAVGIFLFTQATTFVTLLLASLIYRVGGAAITPAAMAMVMDRTPAGRQGAAWATFSASFQLAFMVGGLLSGFIISAAGYNALYLTCTALTVSGLGVLGLSRRMAPATMQS